MIYKYHNSWTSKEGSKKNKKITAILVILLILMKSNTLTSTEKNPNTSFSTSLWVKPIYSPNRDISRPSSSGRRTVYVKPTDNSIYYFLIGFRV